MNLTTTKRPDADTLTVSARRTDDIDDIWELADAGDVLGTMRRSAQLSAAAASAEIDPIVLAEVERLARRCDLGTLAAIELLASTPGPAADRLLVELLAAPDQIVRRHASWRLGRRGLQQQAIPALLVQLMAGGIDTLHAHRTLRAWSLTSAATVVRAVNSALAEIDDPGARARLVDLLGVVDDRGTDALLLDLAVDAEQHDSVRIAALGALGERHDDAIGSVLSRMAQRDDLIGAHAALALQTSTPSPRNGSSHRTDGSRIAQLVLAGGLDGQLSLGGRGETGGVASLLVSLGGALGRHPAIEHVLTIGRGSVSDALTGPLVRSDDPWSFGMIPLGDPARPAASPADAWEHLPTIERGLRRMLRLAEPIDLLHLRMADAGTLAGAQVARAAGIPICFSLAPDPHNVVQSLQSRGELDGESFAQLEADQHIWFRARLIERLGRDADRLALFPRSRPWEFFDDIEPDGQVRPGRTAVVAEGIDLASIHRAEREIAAGPRPPAVVTELVERIPPERRRLPLLISVGRLHPVKGMERVAAAWAADPELRDRCNLVIVGGDLEDPSSSERRVLDAIETAVAVAGAPRKGLVLLGGRPHADIARLLVAAARGHAEAWPAGGVYVDGALKEEFGLAVLEAMAAGLVVVAPSTGGPSTYVTSGDTGVLVDPGAELATAIDHAFRLVPRPGRAGRARQMVERNYSIDTMAEQLVALYEPVAA